MTVFLNLMHRKLEIFQELDTLQREELELHQAYAQDFELIAKKRQNLLSELESSYADACHHTTTAIARTMTPRPAIEEDDYAIIVNLNAHTLRLRHSPEDNSTLEQGSLDGLGSMRMKILVWMLRNPGNTISCGTAPRTYGYPSDNSEPGTFAQTIKHLRDVLGGRGRTNPYILTIPNSEPGKRTHGCTYVMNPAYRYLVVRHEISLESNP